MRIFVIIGGLIVLMLFAALVTPYFVDWGNYRDRFEAEASRVLGQDVRVEGGASARLLPFPSVTFSDVRIGPEGTPNITVEEFSMDAELAPFLSGEILIFDMRLVSPVVRLDLDAEGKPIWEWPSQTPVDPAQISLENAEFVDGTLVLRDTQENRQWDLVGLNGSAAAQSLFGPWRIDGEGLVRGVPFNARLSTGILSRDGFALRVSAQLPTQKIALSTDGRVAPPTGDITRWYSGAFSIKPDDSSQNNYFAEGVFEADGRAISVAQYRADFGDLDDPYTVNGSAQIIGGDAPRFDFTAKGNQVNLTRGDDEAQAIALGERLDNISAVLEALPFPPIAGAIDLDLPAIVLGKTTVRDVVIAAEPSGGSWRINALSANLPGRTVLEGNGLLALGDNTNFVGEMIVASRQPSGLAAWLIDDVDEAIRLLPNAGFSADVSLTKDAQSFENFELIFGDATLSGNLTRLSGSDRLPSIGLSVAGNNANSETIRALGATLFGADGSFRVDDHDVDVELDLNDAKYDGIAIGAVDAALRIRGSRIEFDRLALDDVYGAAISATGTIIEADDGGVPTQKINFDTSIIANDGSTFVAGLGAQMGDNEITRGLTDTAARDPAAFRNTALNFVGSVMLADEGAVEGAISVSGETGGSAVSLTATMQGEKSAPSAMIGTISGTIGNDEATMLLSQAGLSVFPIRLVGAGQVQVNMSGSLDNGLTSRMLLETADSLLSSEGAFQNEQTGLSYKGVASVVTADAEPWMDLFGYIFPSTGLGTPLKAQAAFDYRDGVYNLSNLKGDVAGNTVSGALKIADLAKAPRIDGALTLGSMDAEFLASIVTGRYDLTDPAALFANPLYDDHRIDVELVTEQFYIGNSVIEEAQMRLIYRDGGLALRGFNGALGGGQVSGDLDVQNNSGSLLLTGQMAAHDVDFTSVFAQPPAGLTAAGDLTAAFTGSANTQAALIGAINGSGAMTVKSLLVEGFNGDVIEPLLREADVIGYEITDGQIEEIAARNVEDGTSEFPPIKVPISFSSGQMRASSITADLGASVLSADVDYALSAGTISGNGRIAYEAGENEIAGARPEYSFSFSQADRNSPVIVERDYQLVTAFVRQRALEIEQARVEALQARLLEKQRLRREVRYLRYLEKERLAQIEAERLAKLAKERKAQKAENARLEQIRLEEVRAAQEAERAAEQKRLEAERTLVRPRNDGNGASNLTDRSLLEDPLAPISNSADIFENLDLGLGN